MICMCVTDVQDVQCDLFVACVRGSTLATRKILEDFVEDFVEVFDSNWSQ